MDISQILTLNYKGQEWHLVGDDYEGLNWLSDTPKPTLKDLEKQWPEVQTKIAQMEAEKLANKQAILDRLGITKEEAKLILS